MAEVGRNVPNTIAKAPITFAMIETAVSADCNARKSGWLRYGFKDVTPLFGKQSTVPSLNDSMVGQGREMLKQLGAVNADWYMISGHHGAIYASEYNLFTTDGQPMAKDMSNFNSLKCYNEEQYCGFFNENYHETYWDFASRTNHEVRVSASSPLAAKVANSVYLRTTEAAPSAISPVPQDNPVFDSTAAGPAPKGIILSACNTLIYKKTRTKWSGYFPNSVIIGPFSRIVSGTWVSNAIGAAAMTNESFWRNPQSILDQPGKCEQLEKQLTAAFPSSAAIGVVYKGKIYLKEGDFPVDFDI